MDMQMPVMNGLEATRVIRASGRPDAKTIPIIAMTANAFTEDVVKCKQAGMNDHLSKPIETERSSRRWKIYCCPQRVNKYSVFDFFRTSASSAAYRRICCPRPAWSPEYRPDGRIHAAASSE
jgi:CheY-like chemotaxis protein